MEIKQPPRIFRLKHDNKTKTIYDNISDLRQRIPSNPFSKPYYWIDCGNGADFGQVMLFTVRHTENTISSKYEVISNIPYRGMFDDYKRCYSLVHTKIYKNMTIPAWAVILFSLYTAIVTMVLVSGYLSCKHEWEILQQLKMKRQTGPYANSFSDFTEYHLKCKKCGEISSKTI